MWTRELGVLVVLIPGSESKSKESAAPPHKFQIAEQKMAVPFSRHLPAGHERQESPTPLHSPSLHRKQAVRPWLADSPAAQGVHDRDAGVMEMVPGRQGGHSGASEGAKRPGGHAVRTPSRHLYPGSHGSHAFPSMV